MRDFHIFFKDISISDFFFVSYRCLCLRVLFGVDILLLLCKKEGIAIISNFLKNKQNTKMFTSDNSIKDETLEE